MYLTIGATLAIYLVIGAFAGAFECIMSDDPFRVMSLIDWLPRLLGLVKR